MLKSAFFEGEREGQFQPIFRVEGDYLQQPLLGVTPRFLFTALHVMQTRSSDENSVCLSVRPSVTRVNCDKTEERSVQIYIPYERTFSLVF